jgi:hypothetical protein
MKDSFSLAVTAAVSLHLLLSPSTDFFTRFLYLSSCSSAVGTLLRHSDTALSFALAPVDLNRSCCFRTFSFCAASVACHFSNCDGRAMFSKMSKNVSLSSGGKASQSSWNEPLLMKDELRDERRFGRRLGLPGCDDVGVRGSRGCVSSLLAPSVAVLLMSTAVASSRIAGSEADLGIATGSDIWCARTCCWKKYRSGSLPRNELDRVPRRCNTLTTMTKMRSDSAQRYLDGSIRNATQGTRNIRKHADILGMSILFSAHVAA